MSGAKIVVHTDVFLEHVRGGRRPSTLRLAMGKFFCYTTVFHAIELFGMAKTSAEGQAVRDTLEAMKVLGLNPKNAPRYGALLAASPGVQPWNVLIAGLCIESGLPLLTDREGDFRGVGDLLLVPTRAITNGGSGAEVLRRVQKGRRATSG